MSEYSILEQIKIRLGQYEQKVENGVAYGVVFTDIDKNPILEQFISKAKQDVIRKRNYPKSYDKKKISEDLKNYESVIIDAVVYDYSQIGGEYQKTLIENSIHRTWVSRDSLFEGIIPFVHSL